MGSGPGLCLRPDSLETRELLSSVNQDFSHPCPLTPSALVHSLGPSNVVMGHTTQLWLCLLVGPWPEGGVVVVVGG